MPSPRFLFLHLPLAVFFAFATASTSTAAAANNITNILSPLPQYSQYNSFLTQTKLADDINSRANVTVLVLAGPAAAALSSMSLSNLKTALSLLVLVDYLDPKRLHNLPDGSATYATLYQTTSGSAQGLDGLVKVSHMTGGIGFVSAVTPPGLLWGATLVRAIELIPDTISVIEISAPILQPYILASSPPTVHLSNLSAILEKAGCGIFVSLLTKTGVMKTYEDSASKGLTVFAPVDDAFTAANAPDLSKLNGTDTVELLLYHALPQYVPFKTMKSSAGRSFTTLATNGTSKYELSVTASGDQLTVKAGASTAKVGVIVVDSALVVIYVIDHLLIPVELSGKLVPTHEPAPALPPNASPPSSFSPPPPPSPPTPPPSLPPPSPPPPPVHGHSPAAAPSGKGNTASPPTPHVPTESPSSSPNPAANVPGTPPPVPSRTPSYAEKGRSLSWEALAAATAFSWWWVMG